MLKFSISNAALILIAGTLAFSVIGCGSSDEPTRARRGEIAPATKPASTPPPAMQPAVKGTRLFKPEQFELALDKASAAFSISQSAQSVDDWKLVANQWQEAIALMKAIPADNPYKSIADSKISEYQQNITYAQQQATRLASVPNPDTIVEINPTVAPPPDTEMANTLQTPPVIEFQQQVFQVPIKRRDSGTPVIDVIFNGTQQFEMIVDTGASGTVITQQTAAALGVVPVTTAKANTASAKAVEFPIGYVDSIEVGGAVATHIPVAIAPSPALETGLLGHDFFHNYDVTFKRDVIEFRPQ